VFPLTHSAYIKRYSPVFPLTHSAYIKRYIEQATETTRAGRPLA
jgi:hypothetical protein